MVTRAKSFKVQSGRASGRNIFYREQIQQSISVLQKTVTSCEKPLLKAADLLVASFRNRGKLLICGNGGSAADAQHLAAELVIRLSKKIKRPGLPALSLSADTSALTAGSNDLGFDHVFARQVEALGHPEDVLLVISTSGNSPNLLRALHMAVEKRIKRVALLGCGGGKCLELVTIPIVVPSSNVQRIQETQILLGHMLIELVETELYGG
jgi:D-sedoheptulose 7-phosphate isomerase